MLATRRTPEADTRDVYLLSNPVHARAMVAALRGARRLVGDRPQLGLPVVADTVAMGGTLCRAFRGAVSFPDCVRICRVAVQTEANRAAR